MKDKLTPDEQAQVDRLFGEIQTMRKYQKRFFDGDKSILRTAIFWEKQVDQSIAQITKDLEIRPPQSKGDASQGSLL